MADFLKKLPDGASGTSLAQEAVGVGDLNRVIGVLNGTDGPVGSNFFALNPPTTTKGGAVVAGLEGAIYDKGGAVWNMQAPKYIAIGTWDPIAGTGDFAAAYAQAKTDATASPAGGCILFTSGFYKTSSSLAPASHLELLGVAGYSDSTSPFPTCGIQMNAGNNLPVFSSSSSIHNFKLSNMYIRGNSASGNIGISASSANDWELYNLFFDNFGDEAVKITSGTAGAFDRLWIQNSLLVRTGRGSFVGCFTFGGTDSFMSRITATASTVTGDGAGNIAAILLSGTNCSMSDCVGHIAQLGVAVTGSSNRLTNVRTDNCNGQGFEVDGQSNQLTNCTSYKNSRSADGVSSGFVVAGGGNVFTSCVVDDASDAVTQMKNGFDDSNVNPGYPNKYIGCDVHAIRGVPYTATGTVAPVILDPANAAVKALTYSASIATDATLAEYFTLAVTNGTAFTMVNPTNMPTGKIIEYEILNSSGGAMGVITWGSAGLFKMPAFTNPGNGLRTTVRFRYNGTNLVQVGAQSAAF